MKTAFGTFESYAQEISRLRAENEELRWRIDGLLGTGQICPLPKLNGKKFRMVNLIASRSPNLVTYEAMRFAMYRDPLENEVLGGDGFENRIVSKTRFRKLFFRKQMFRNGSEPARTGTRGAEPALNWTAVARGAPRTSPDWPGTPPP